MRTGTIPPHMQLAIMSREYVVSRSIHAIAHLGIADHMSDKPMSVKEIAALTNTIPELLDRVLSFLAAYGLFSKTEDHYALTELSFPLRQDHPYSIKDVLGMVDESWWQAFAHLETELKTGNPAFQQEHGTDFFDFLSKDKQKKAQFEKGLARLSVYDDNAIAQAFDFGTFNSLINLGAGNETISHAISGLHPGLSITTQAIDAPLASADAYLLKGILHDLNDTSIKHLLDSYHQQIKKSSSLIIAEQVIPEHNLPHTNKTMDIVMMVLVGGRQRSLSEWRKLIESSGFRLNHSIETKGVYMVMEYVTV